MRTRTETRTRQVPHTIDDETVLVDEQYTVLIPQPPADWDRIVLNTVTAAAGLLVTASVVWSTASIGDLLTHVTVAAAAYGAASVFDLAWIMCMGVEWLARYDTRRAHLPRRAGHVALAVAMAAVAAHGWLAGQTAIGIIGACVSGIAKGAWTVVLRHHAKPLDPRTQQWVDVQRAKAGGRLAMTAVRRELQRTQAAIEAERLALQPRPDVHPDASPDDPDESADDPDGVVLPMRPGRMSIADAVRTAVVHGILDPDRVLAYVRKTADPSAPEETVKRYLRTQRKQGA
ncbi:protein transporter Sec31 [Streptomyces sp. NPDC059928]|uniref:protein transporter Sec31 n=1 Tax=unclassified Streptomyces TaxID=2593676 RepID=UPI00364608D6